MTVEVFKTNVQKSFHATLLVDAIQGICPGYEANFDLDDCDRILRVVSSINAVDVSAILRIVNAFGFNAEVLSDEIPALLWS